MNLGVDPKHADQMVRGAIVLPHGTGRSVRVLVFAKGDKEKEAQDAGADYVGAEDLAKKIQDEGWLDFERVIATPDMMSVVGRLGKVLGPRGLMPNPKLGTVTPDVGRAVSESKAGKVEFRVDKNGIIHASIGRNSFEAAKLADNATAIIDAVLEGEAGGCQGDVSQEDRHLHHDGSGDPDRSLVGSEGRLREEWNRADNRAEERGGRELPRQVRPREGHFRGGLLGARRPGREPAARNLRAEGEGDFMVPVLRTP